MTKPLEEIIKQCQKRDRAAQKEIYQQFSSILFSICLRYADNYEDAQDTFQEGFITIYNKIDQYKFEGSFEGWLKRIMVNQALAKFRTKTYLNTDELDHITDLTEDEETIDIAFGYDELLELVHQLSPQYRQVFNLYVFEEYSHQEIAEILNISVNTSKSNLSRARNILKEKINLLKNPS